MFCCMLLYVHSSIVIILMGKRELIALCYDIMPVRKEEGKSYWKIPLCDDDATREK